MKISLINQVEVEIWAETGSKFSAIRPNQATNSVWAQQRPNQESWKNPQKANSSSSAIRSKQSAKGFVGFYLAISGCWLIERHNQVVTQSLVRTFFMVMLEILVDRVSHRSLTEQYQSIETFRLQ